MYEDVTLVDLISPSILQKMQNSFAQMARMAAITTNENGVPVTKGTNFTRMCSEMCRTSEKGRKRCENCDRNGASMTLEKQKPVSYECHAHLVDFAAPIMLGDRMIGSFVGGQVLAESIDPDKMREVAREIEVDEEELWQDLKTAIDQACEMFVVMIMEVRSCMVLMRLKKPAASSLFIGKSIMSSMATRSALAIRL